MVWKYLLLLIFLQKNPFWEKVDDLDVRPDCLHVQAFWVTPVVPMKNKKPEKIGLMCLNSTEWIVIKAVYWKPVMIWGLPNPSHRWKVLENEIF